MDQASLTIAVHHDKLLFAVFSLLQNLGADERPEVGCDMFFGRNIPPVSAIHMPSFIDSLKQSNGSTFFMIGL